VVESTLIIAIVVPVGVVILVILCVILWILLRCRNHTPLKELKLPENWIWEPSYLVNQAYIISQTDPVYYYKEVDLDPKSGSKESTLFFELKANMEFENLLLSKVLMLSTPTLAENMSNSYLIMTERMRTNAAVFGKKDWKTRADNNIRSLTMDQFVLKYKQFHWNQDLTIENCPVVPVAHGTSVRKALKIAATGFASLSTLDLGFYGKGMYFSSSAIYTLPYMSALPDPCILICFLLPGNPYPVIEHPQTEIGSLLGSHIISGYQSHYVVTTREGFPFTEENYGNQRMFDEYVIDQESQVVPIFLVEVNPSNLSLIGTEYARDIIQPPSEVNEHNSENIRSTVISIEEIVK